MSGKFALIIGNTEYTDPGLAQLTAPGKDAEDFARVLKDRDICAFDDIKILLNEPEAVVSEAIDEFFDQKRPDDLLVLYFSGHGVRDELGALYLAVRNTNRFRLRSTAIKSDYIREVMDQSRSRRQVLILDCCNSGAFSQGTKAATGVSIGTASAFEGGYGRIILTASDSIQFAWEGDKVIGETDNSLFTHFLVQGLEGEADLDGDGSITVDELYDYAYEKVRLATPKQTPSKFSSKQQGEIILRKSIRIEDIKPVSLPSELVDEIEDTRPYVREAAVQKLEKILKGKNIGLAHSAKEALEKIVEDENTTRRVSQTATNILESFRLVEQKAVEERMAREEEERLTREKADAERKAIEEAERLATAQAEREAAEREAAERAAREVVERAAREKAEQEATRIKAARAAAENAAREKAERDKARRAAVERAAREKAESNAAQKTAQGRVIFYNNVSTFVKSILRSRRKLLFFSVPAILVALSIFLAFQLSPTTTPDNITLPFSGVSAGGIDAFWYGDNHVIKLTESQEGANNWAPASYTSSRIYFTSDRSGKAEIYVIINEANEGKLLRITGTPGGAESWSPSVGPSGHLYFTSNRSGKAEIWALTNQGELLQITDTSEDYESWSPAVGVSGHLYFTSNRSGKAEIWVVTNKGELLQITDTPGGAENWSPSVGPSGHLYFTSNRSGKAEIWALTNQGELLQITDTPGDSESWSPVARGQNIFYTSDRSGEIKVYMLSAQAQVTAISTVESWTERWANPFPYIKP